MNEGPVGPNPLKQYCRGTMRQLTHHLDRMQ